MTEHDPRTPGIGGVKSPTDRGLLSTYSLADDQTIVELPSPGELLGDFQIVEELGRGAFGTVYRAWQKGIDREVAVKLSRARTHETRTLSRLDGHPNIVRIYDQRELPERGLHLLYMEFVRGVSLRDAIATQFSLPAPLRPSSTLAQVIARCGQDATQPPAKSHAPATAAPDRTWVKQICAMGAQIADALHFAHRKSILHCDIKPANIVLNADGTPKVVDFNTSYTLDIDQSSIGGTLAYMAPEQLAALQEPDEARRAELVAKLDGRNDIYSLGIVLWEALTGGRPFEEVAPQAAASLTVADLVRQRQHLSVGRALERLPEDLPQGVRAVLARCLAPDPQQRYATAGELAHELRLACNDEFWSLVHPAESPWRKLIEDWRGALAILLLVGIVPNILLSVLDTVWVTQVLARAGLADLRDTYLYFLAPGIKAIAYPLGAAVGIWCGWPIFYALRQESETREPEASEAAAGCVSLGQNIALVSVISWTIAGFVVGLYIGLQTGSLQVTLNAVGSLILGGTIAAPLAFFPITWVCVDMLLPRFVRQSRRLPAIDLDRQMEFYLAVAQFAPLLALGLALAVNLEGAEFFYLKLALLVVAALGMAVARWCYAVIRADLKLLSELPAPASSA